MTSKQSENLNSQFDIQSDEYSEIYEEKQRMNNIANMLGHLDELYFDLLDKNHYGSDYHFDESWIDDIKQFSKYDSRISRLVFHLENSNYDTAKLYIQDILDNDTEQQLVQIETERLARLSLESIGNL